jgi:hypothetical protein
MRLLNAERFIRVHRRADKTCESQYRSRFSPLNSFGTDLMADLIIWSCIEPSLGIVCACLPLLHPFFKRHSPEKIVGAYSDGYSSVHTNNPAHIPHTSKEFEEFSERVAQYHENIIE